MAYYDIGETVVYLGKQGCRRIWADLQKKSNTAFDDPRTGRDGTESVGIVRSVDEPLAASPIYEVSRTG